MFFWEGQQSSRGEIKDINGFKEWAEWSIMIWVDVMMMIMQMSLLYTNTYICLLWRQGNKDEKFYILSWKIKDVSMQTNLDFLQTKK